MINPPSPTGPAVFRPPKWEIEKNEKINPVSVFPTHHHITSFSRLFPVLLGARSLPRQLAHRRRPGSLPLTIPELSEASRRLGLDLSQPTAILATRLPAIPRLFLRPHGRLIQPDKPWHLDYSYG